MRDARILTRLRRTVSVLVLILAGGLAAPVHADELRGVALVIGQADYETLTDLGNPLNDARAMDELLSDLGFDVTRVLDRGGDRLKREIEDFIADAEGADVALVYYAGHAVEAAGQNFLVPIDAALATPASAGESLVPVGALLDELARTVPVTIVLLDACRTEAFPDGTAVLLPGTETPVAIGDTGLSEMRGPTPVLANIDPESLGMVIGFAAAPGQAALDGPSGGNSPYAAALLKHMAAGGYAFGDLMTMVTEEVYLRTGARQVPWTNSSLRRVLSFGEPVEEDDDEAPIREGRRKLLLSIAATPMAVRQQVEAAAASGGVPMDTLYGLLDAMGEEAPSDPGALDQLLKAQTETIRKVMDERRTLTSTDTEIVRLAGLAQQAFDEGALEVSLSFWEQAKTRYAAISASLDQTEAQLKQRRLEGGALLARTGDAYAASGDFAAAADNFRLAFAEVERWDDAAAGAYKTAEASATYSLGTRKGDNAALTRSVTLYEEALVRVPGGTRQWAILQRNIGNSHGQLSARNASDASVAAAIAAYEAALTVFDREREPREWAMTQARLATALSIRSGRETGSDTLRATIDAYRAALEVLSPSDDLLEWTLAQNNLGVTTQDNLGNVLSNLGQGESGTDSLSGAVTAYRNALLEFTPQNGDARWAELQRKLGNALSDLGMREESGIETFQEALDAYNAATSVFTAEADPLAWATTANSAGWVLAQAGYRIGDIDAIRKGRETIQAALDVLHAQGLDEHDAYFAERLQLIDEVLATAAQPAG